MTQNAKPLFDELRNMELHGSSPIAKSARVKAEVPVKKESDAFAGTAFPCVDGSASSSGASSVKEESHDTTASDTVRNNVSNKCLFKKPRIQ